MDYSQFFWIGIKDSICKSEMHLHSVQTALGNFNKINSVYMTENIQRLLPEIMVIDLNLKGRKIQFVAPMPEQIVTTSKEFAEV